MMALYVGCEILKCRNCGKEIEYSAGFWNHKPYHVKECCDTIAEPEEEKHIIIEGWNKNSKTGWTQLINTKKGKKK